MLHFLKFRRALLCLLLLLLAAAQPSSANEGHGTLVIIGGALRYKHQVVWNRIVELAGGQHSKIAVLPTASSEPLVYGTRAVNVLRAAGADAFLVPVHAEQGRGALKHQAADPLLVEAVKSATGVYMIGGSQERITAALGSTAGDRSPLLDAIWQVYRRGGVIAGTSAGAAVMSDKMFRGSRTVLETLRDGLSVGKELAPGLGFLDPAWFVEQHCLVRGRFGRTLVALRTLGLKYGVGVDEDTAVVVQGGNKMSALGTKGAIILDLSVSTTDAGVKEFNIHGARLSYLDSGDTIDLSSLTITPMADKEPVDAPPARSSASEEAPFVVADILGSGTVVDVMARAAGGRQPVGLGLAFDAAQVRMGPGRGFEFRFYRGPDTRSWHSSVSGASTYTVSNIYLDIRPVDFNGPLYK
jgi:cyanophycinase